MISETDRSPARVGVRQFRHATFTGALDNDRLNPWLFLSDRFVCVSCYFVILVTGREISKEDEHGGC